jgi:hypothetical protein
MDSTCKAINNPTGGRVSNLQQLLLLRMGRCVVAAGVLVAGLAISPTAALPTTIRPPWSVARCDNDLTQQGTVNDGLFRAEGYPFQSLNSIPSAWHADNPSTAINDSQATMQSNPSGGGGTEEWKRRVEARYKAARNGGIEIFLPASWRAGESIAVRVRVMRVPEGADSLLAPPKITRTEQTVRTTGILKVDDEMQVTLSSPDEGSVVIENTHPELIRDILPGGYAEWKWNVKMLQPGERHLVVTADVVYRRNFLSDGPPKLTFQSFTKILPVQVGP